MTTTKTPEGPHCPYCDHEQTGDCNTQTEPDEIVDCENCDKGFRLVATTVVTWKTSKVRQPRQGP